MDESKTFLSRRRIIKGAGVATGVGIIGGGSLLYSTQPALAATGSSITADDLSINTNSGSVTEVTITPNLTLDWSDFSSGINGFEVVVKAAPSGASSLNTATDITGISDSAKSSVDSFSVQGSSTGSSLSDPSGTADITLAGVPLVSNNALTASTDLPTNVGDGQSANTTVDYAVTVTATSGSGGNSASDTSPSPSGSFTVTLDNTSGSTTATGNVTTNGTTS